MADHATPNLPSRDFAATSLFYESLGFSESWRDPGWMILKRGGLTVEFFRYPDLDPAMSSFGCCFRMDDVDAFFETLLSWASPSERPAGRGRIGPSARPGVGKSGR